MIAVARVMPARKTVLRSAVWILPSLTEEDVGAGAFGDAALPVQHQSRRQ